MTRIRLTSLTKRFGTRLALDHLDLTVEAGGFTVLVGPSGCGKTTTLRLIAGLETPSAGGVSFNGDVPQVAASMQKRLDQLMQDGGYY
jgi:ABC-type sugar transport system ATPase subunit